MRVPTPPPHRSNDARNAQHRTTNDRAGRKGSKRSLGQSMPPHFQRRKDLKSDLPASQTSITRSCACSTISPIKIRLGLIIKTHDYTRQQQRRRRRQLAGGPMNSVGVLPSHSGCNARRSAACQPCCCSERAEALLAAARARRDDSQHVEAHGLGQRPEGSGCCCRRGGAHYAACFQSRRPGGGSARCAQRSDSPLVLLLCRSGPTQPDPARRRHNTPALPNDDGVALVASEAG